MVSQFMFSVVENRLSHWELELNIPPFKPYPDAMVGSDAGARSWWVVGCWKCLVSSSSLEVDVARADPSWGWEEAPHFTRHSVPRNGAH